MYIPRDKCAAICTHLTTDELVQMYCVFLFQLGNIYTNIPSQHPFTQSKKILPHLKQARSYFIYISSQTHLTFTHTRRHTHKHKATPPRSLLLTGIYTTCILSTSFSETSQREGLALKSSLIEETEKKGSKAGKGSEYVKACHLLAYECVCGGTTEQRLCKKC